MTTDLIQMPSSTEEAVEQFNDALGPHPYLPYHHYDLRVGKLFEASWAMIVLDRSHQSGDTPVEVKIVIMPNVEINWAVLQDLVDNYCFSSHSAQNVDDTGDFTLTYRLHLGAALETLVITGKPSEHDIQVTYQIVQRRSPHATL